MKRTTIYWLLLFGVLVGISYIYSSSNRFDESSIYQRKNKLFKTIQVGDLYVLMDSMNEVQKFFKIVGNSTSDSITIAIGNLTYKNNSKSRDWTRKMIDRSIYFEPKLANLSPQFIDDLSNKTDPFIIYRQKYPPDQFPIFIHLLHSPLAIILLILTVFFIIWFADNCSLYLSSRFTRLSKETVLGVVAFIIALFIARIQFKGYLAYVTHINDEWAPSFLFEWFISWANTILEMLPVFILFQLLRKKYFKRLQFADQEFWKFLTIFLGGILFQFIVVHLIAWVVPKYSIPAISYIRNISNGIGSMNFYSHLIKEYSILWGIIATGNFLNNLRKKIKELRQKEKLLIQSEEQILSSQSQLDALQARVNPHFLYNSLNSIASLAQTNPAKTEEMALALSDFYKHNTNRQDQHWSTLGEEIELIKNYLDIEKIRFENRLQYQLEIPENTDPYPIPRFLLQPLVENAIKYGFDKKENKIAISINVEASNKQLQIRILDSGLPFSGHMNMGYGLRSVKKKLKLLYPNAHELHFMNEPIKQVHIILNPLKNHQNA